MVFKGYEASLDLEKCKGTLYWFLGWRISMGKFFWSAICFRKICDIKKVWP